MERSRFGGALVLSFDYSTEYIQYWAPIQRICKQETLLPIRSLSLAFSGLLLFFFFLLFLLWLISPFFLL